MILPQNFWRTCVRDKSRGADKKVCVTSRYAFDFSMKSRFPWTHSSGEMTMASHGRKSLPTTQKTTSPSYQHRRRRRLALLIVSYAFPSLSRSFSVWRSATWSSNSPRLSVNPFHSYRRKRGYSASQKISWNSISPTFYIIHENWASGFLAEPFAHISLRHEILSYVIFASTVKIFTNI